jgi:hypothetical protein
MNCVCHCQSSGSKNETEHLSFIGGGRVKFFGAGTTHKFYERKQN